MRVVVPSSEALRSYEFNGKTYWEQEAALYNGGHFPVPFHVTVNDPKNLYPKGEYVLDPKNFGVTERGKLVLKSTRLLPASGSSAPGK